MAFDSHSLERLKELGRQLPKELEVPITSSEKTSIQKKSLHPIETEQDPKKLFKELMNASLDGNVPQHLLNRLKKMENIEIETELSQIKNEAQMTTDEKHQNALHSNDTSYIQFKQLLLEEEESN